MHENGTSVWACHFGASKTYGAGEHVNANTILHMKVINELEHGHKPCGKRYFLWKGFWELL
jgi:hypothetical protein